MGNKASGRDKKDPTVLTEEDLNTLKTNTQYSEDEILAWHSGFLKDCPTGKLDRKQFLSVYRVCDQFRFILNLILYFHRDSIQRVKLINIVTSYLKHLIQIIIIGLILLNFCKKIFYKFSI